ncbi:hypothetical protein J6590_026896 [Homalodisca vitripennis]|nr:hypothetical protein J6590_026896 [Homalodisca vitripennis]
MYIEGWHIVDSLTPDVTHGRRCAADTTRLPNVTPHYHVNRQLGTLPCNNYFQTQKDPFKWEGWHIVDSLTPDVTHGRRCAADTTRLPNVTPHYHVNRQLGTLPCNNYFQTQKDPFKWIADSLTLDVTHGRRCAADTTRRLNEGWQIADSLTPDVTHGRRCAADTTRRLNPV